jgi:hypothetical protein
MATLAFSPRKQPGVSATCSGGQDASATLSAMAEEFDILAAEYAARKSGETVD